MTTSQSGRVYDASLQFDAIRLAALPRTFVDCTSPALPTIAAMRERVRAEPRWRIVELQTGHDPMVSTPREPTDALLGAV